MKRLEVKKYPMYKDDENYYGIDLKRDDEKVLSIIFGRNLDLYFTLNNYGDNPTFLVGKDNYQIYALFDKLYKRVIDADIYGKLMEDEIKQIVFFSTINNEDYHEKIAEEEKRRGKYQKDLKKRLSFQKLVQNGEIIWMSDEYFEEITPYVKIKKLKNAYLLEFIKPVVPDKYKMEVDLSLMDPFSISIRFRNSGSRYEPFNMLFMELYHNLCLLDFELDQVHIEEYLINEQISRGYSLARILKK